VKDDHLATRRHISQLGVQGLPSELHVVTLLCISACIYGAASCRSTILSIQSSISTRVRVGGLTSTSSVCSAMHSEPWLSPDSTTTNTDDCLGISAMLEGMGSKISSYQAGCSTCPKYYHLRLLVAVPLKNHLCNPETIKGATCVRQADLERLRPREAYVEGLGDRESTANYGCQGCGYEKEERLNMSVATADGSDMVDPPSSWAERDENGDDLKYKHNSTFITTSTRWISMAIFTQYVAPGMESGPLLLFDQHNTSGRRKQSSHATTSVVRSNDVTLDCSGLLHLYSAREGHGQLSRAPRSIPCPTESARRWPGLWHLPRG
jgi:hypothetical protein